MQQMSVVAGDAVEQTLISVCTDVVERYPTPSRWQRRKDASRRPRSSAEVNPRHAGEA